jgi:hypothetical protein
VIGQKYTITWDGTGLNGVVDLALCQGPPAACNIVGDIALGIANTNSYSWTVDCALAATTTNAGYGIVLIEDATGRFQYSTQFGLLADTAGVCGGKSGKSSATGSASVSASASGSPTSGQSTRTSQSGSLTTSTSSDFAPTGTGTAPTGAALNSTSTTYVMPTKPAGNPVVTPSTGAASTVARCMGGLAAAVLAAVVLLA